MQKGLVSIIIPCYNCEKYISDTIKCLDAQTYKNFEAIFVNDGSTDDTLNKLTSLCEDKNNFKVLSKENGGVSSARNYGLSHAEGEFVFFFDADDLLSENHLEVIVQEIEDYDCLVTSYKNIDDKTKFEEIDKIASFNKTEIFEGSENLIGELLRKKFLTSFWNKLLRHSILKEFKSYPNVFTENIHYGEDTLFGVEYFLYCKNAKYINLKSYFYRRHAGSLSKNFGKKLLTISESFEKYLDLCRNNPVAQQYVKSFICMVCIELLFRARFNKFYDEKIINYLFKTLKNYKKDLKKCKKALFYYKYFISCTIFVLKILFLGKFKTHSEK